MFCSAQGRVESNIRYNIDTAEMTCPDPQYTLLTKKKDSRAKEEAKQQNPFSSFNDRHAMTKPVDLARFRGSRNHSSGTRSRLRYSSPRHFRAWILVWSDPLKNTNLVPLQTRGHGAAVVNLDALERAAVVDLHALESARVIDLDAVVGGAGDG